MAAVKVTGTILAPGVTIDVLPKDTHAPASCFCGFREKTHSKWMMMMMAPFVLHHRLSTFFFSTCITDVKMTDDYNNNNF